MRSRDVRCIRRKWAKLVVVTAAMLLGLLPQATATQSDCTSLIEFDYDSRSAYATFTVDFACKTPKQVGRVRLAGQLARCTAPGIPCEENVRRVRCPYPECELKLELQHSEIDAAVYQAVFTYKGNGKARPSGFSEVEVICYSLPPVDAACEG